MRTTSPLSIRRTLAGIVGAALVAATTLGGATAALAVPIPQPTCVTGVCTISFPYTGEATQWTVPDGVTSVTASVAAGSGGQATYLGSTYGPAAAGAGGAVRATLPVSAREELDIAVGGSGHDGVQNSSAAPAAGGFGGGGSAGTKSAFGRFGSGGGGGGSFIFGAGSLLVAAGGGGGASVAQTSGAVYPVPGGEGGSAGAGSSGSDAKTTYASEFSGKGATSFGPGAGGTKSDFYAGSPGGASPASASSFGTGGAGADNPSVTSETIGGAGGGGGYFGAGGGGTSGSTANAGAGGGGSGFVAASATDVHSLTPNTGDGVITLTYADPNYATTTTLKASTDPTDDTPTVFSVTVAPTTATGTVSFRDGTADLGSATLTDGVASLSKTLAAGPHEITASYPGDANHGPSDATITVTVAEHSVAPTFAAPSSSTAPIMKQAVAGQAFSFTGLAATGTPTPTSTYTVTDADGHETDLPDGVSFTDGSLAGTSDLAGTWDITVTATNSAGSADEHIRLTITAGPVAGLEAIVDHRDSGTSSGNNTSWIVDADGSVTAIDDSGVTSNATITAKQGSVIEFVTTATDRFDNPVGDDDRAVQPVTTSSVASDTISYDTATKLTTVRFNHASPHVITFTADGITNSFTVQVSPTAATTPTPSPTSTATPVAATPTSGTGRLANTGVNPATPIGWAIATLIPGIGLVILRHRRTRNTDGRHPRSHPGLGRS